MRRLAIAGLAAALAMPAAAETVTIFGTVHYNDQRSSGYFDLRNDESGVPGEMRRGTAAAPTENYLAGRGMTVEVVEIDPGSILASCEDESDVLATALIGKSGRFNITFEHTDPCPTDTARYAVRVALDFCNLELDEIADRCIRMKDANGDVYRLEMPGATTDAPLTPVPFTSNHAGALRFELGPGGPDDYAVAANYYAALVDATKYVHQDVRVDFLYDEWGAVRMIYPAAVGTCNATHNRIRCPATSGWPIGKVVFHEYGHVIHARRWDRRLAWCDGCTPPDGRDGNASWSPHSLEHPPLALSEGFANFVSRDVRQLCLGGFDENRDEAGEVKPDKDFQLHPRGAQPPAEGEAYAGNVTKALCDMRDFVDDDDPLRPGAGDQISLTFKQITSLLEDLYQTSTEARQDEGYDICDLLWFYGTGATDLDNLPAGYEALPAWAEARDLAWQNAIPCGFPEPT